MRANIDALFDSNKTAVLSILTMAKGYSPLAATTRYALIVGCPTYRR